MSCNTYVKHVTIVKRVIKEIKKKEYMSFVSQKVLWPS